MALCFTIEAPIEPKLFRLAFQALVDASDALRTVIRDREGVPYQDVLPSLAYTPDILELEESKLQEWALQRSQRPFSLDLCLFDSALVQLNPSRFVWFFNQHHLTTDAWSTSLVYKRMGELYHQLSLEEPLTGALPQFASYLDLERLARANPDGKSVTYWQSNQNSRPPLPDFYGRNGREAGTATHRNSVSLGATRSAALRQLARDPRVRLLTRDMSLFSLFATLLYAYVYRVSGQSELSMGVPAHNRPTVDLKNTIGLCLEILPLSVSVETGETFLSLLKKVRKEFGSFLRYARPGASSAASNRNFNFLLNFITATFPHFGPHQASADWIHTGQGDPNHLLRLQVHDFEEKGEFRLDFDLNCEVFQEQKLATGHYQKLLDAMLGDLEQDIATVPLTSSTEREGLALCPGLGAEKTILDLLWRGSGVALSCRDENLEYAELRHQVDTWAQVLRAQGVGPGVRVGLYMERSIELIVGLLAVLQAGAAYVPVDVSYPAPRVEFMLEDSGCSTFLTKSRWELNRPGRLDMDLKPPSERSEGPLPRAGDPAYVLYTSGSTGQPKGVVVSHGALANYLNWADSRYVRGEALTFPFFSSIAFDLTVTSIFLPLISGGRLIIYPSNGQVDLALMDVLDEDAVDVLKLTPSHLLLTEGRLPKMKRLRRIILGGENLRRDQVVGSRLEVINEYGPTEATVGCIVHTFDDTRDTGPNVPIGRPVAGMQAYVLDPNQQLLPNGLTGELYLSGPSLAEGYLQRPQQEGAAFLDNPFAPGQRMYRTGDLARRRPDGTLEYAGRADHQVKIRGVRIELGEVEARLREHPSIEKCVVRASMKAQSPQQPVFHCGSCGLASNYPGITFDTEGVCAHCRAFEIYEPRARAYFQGLSEFRSFFEPRPPGPYDCIVLLSGGKDSCYALYRIVEMGLRVLAFTLDNGYISEQAKANITRVVQTLGVEHVFASTPHMNEIFSDSLRRHCNVCQGCFKTIYTLSTNLALEKEIPYVVTGLSRGQFFETRLTEELFTDPNVVPASIDETVLHARKAYHRVEDAVARLLDVSHFQTDDVFEKVRFLDFYRYCDVDLEEVLSTLRRELPWIRPSDTGRSTNCRINDVGIYVHKRERGYHNYALPYSWDVRLGHKQREEALEELDDEFDLREIEKILNEIGYNSLPQSGQERLVAYLTSPDDLDASAISAWLKERVPEFLVPTHYLQLLELPLTPNGKVDLDALPEPETSVKRASPDFLPPSTPTEELLAEIWASVLELSKVGVTDNFFDLGGDSIAAIRIIANANKHGMALTHSQIFLDQTIRALAQRAARKTTPSDQGLVLGQAPLTPIQHWFFGKNLPNPGQWCHILQLTAPPDLDQARLRDALGQLVLHHDALRLSFQQIQGRWTQTHLAPFEVPLETELRFPQLAGPLLRASLIDGVLNLVLHHLVSDGLSWLILVEDLDRLYRQVNLPAKTTSYKKWAEAVLEYEPQDVDYWRTQARHRNRLPLDFPIHTRSTESANQTVSRDLTPALSRSLQETANRLHCELPELLLSTFALALKEWTGFDRFVIDLEASGRERLVEGLDTSRTVGWFTALHPFVLRVGSPVQVRQDLNGVPTRGVDYGVWRYLHGEVDESPAEILFTYFGRLGSVGDTRAFTPAGPPQLKRDPEGEREYLLEFFAMMAEDTMRLYFLYSSTHHRRDTITRLADSVTRQLDKLVRSSFPLAGLKEGQLAKVAGLLKQSKESRRP